MGNLDSWTRTSSEQVADCRVFEVRRDFCTRDPHGGESDFYVIDSPDWVNIIARTKGGDVVLIEQYRHGAEEMHLELPGGLIDPGESPIEAAKRELREETGYASGNWLELGRSRPNPAIQNNTIFHFLALDCEKDFETAFDEHESIATTVVSGNDIDRLVAGGQITHSLVLAALLLEKIRVHDAAE